MRWAYSILLPAMEMMLFPPPLPALDLPRPFCQTKSICFRVGMVPVYVGFSSFSVSTSFPSISTRACACRSFDVFSMCAGQFTSPFSLSPVLLGFSTDPSTDSPYLSFPVLHCPSAPNRDNCFCLVSLFPSLPSPQEGSRHFSLGLLASSASPLVSVATICSW